MGPLATGTGCWGRAPSAYYACVIQPRDWREEALKVPCPVAGCHAAPGWRCTYVNRGKEAYRYYHPGRVGSLSHRPHPERIMLARVQWLRANPVPLPTMLSAEDAMRQFEVQEYLRLIAWLKEHGPILWNLRKDP